jgi:hypothetical protein
MPDSRLGNGAAGKMPWDLEFVVGCQRFPLWGINDYRGFAARQAQTAAPFLSSSAPFVSFRLVTNLSWLRRFCLPGVGMFRFVLLSFSCELVLPLQYESGTPHRVLQYAAVYNWGQRNSPSRLVSVQGQPTALDTPNSSRCRRRRHPAFAGFEGSRLCWSTAHWRGNCSIERLVCVCIVTSPEDGKGDVWKGGSTCCVHDHGVLRRLYDAWNSQSQQCRAAWRVFHLAGAGGGDTVLGSVPYPVTATR